MGPKRDTRLVFVVHGRNDRLVGAVKSLVEKAGLTPMSWTEAKARAGGGTPHTIDVIRSGMDAAQAVLVLLSDDEQVSLRKELRTGKIDDHPEGFQARPNVLVEAGMALAVDGSRTVLVKVGDLRPISDLDGLNYETLDETPESRRAVVAALRRAGCEVTSDRFHDMKELKFLHGKSGPTPC